MKTLRFLMLALLLPVFVMTGCDKGGEENPGDSQIELPNDSEKTQQAFADGKTTGGFTFTAKQAWTATVTETGASRANNVEWLRLLLNDKETYTGAAGNFTLAIELDENYSGKTRTATITIKSGNDTITVTQDGKTQDGIVPVDPEKPDPTGMKYISRIDFDVSYGDFSYIIEYDAKNRISKIMSDDSNYGEGTHIQTFSYDDAARTVTMVLEEDDYEEEWILKLNASGAIESGTAYGDPFTASYTDGNLNQFVLSPGEGLDEEIFTMTWSAGDKKSASHSWKNEDSSTGAATGNLTYNASWANNPLCNLDLNALIAPFDDGIFMGYPELMGLFGNRSQHMVSGYTTTGGSHDGQTVTSTVEYDTDGFVTKITVVSYDKDSPADGHTTVSTITYR